MTKKIMVFNGPSGSGKDTAAQAAGARLFAHGIHATKMKISDPIKQAVHKLYGLFYEPGYYEDGPERALKDQEHPLLFGMSPRQAYIDMSDMIQDRHGMDRIGHITANKLHNHKNPVVVFSDSGILEEWPPIIDYIGAKNVLWVEIAAQSSDSNGFANYLTFEGDSRNYIGVPLKQQYPDLTLKRIPNTISNDPLDKELFVEMVKGTVDNFFKDMYHVRLSG